MAATNEQLLARWSTEAGRTDAHWLTHSPNYRVDRTTGMLTYVRIDRDRLRDRRVIIRERMGMFVGHRFKKGVFVLNGDGFEDGWATEAQAGLRTLVQGSFGWERTAIIPFQALDGAQIDIDSIKAIQITQDTQQAFSMMLPGAFRERHIPALCEPLTADISGATMPDGWRCTEGGGSSTQVWEGELENVRVRITLHRASRTSPFQVHRLHTWAQPEFGQWAWQATVWANQSYLTLRSATNPMGDASYQTGWYWVEEVHRLGSVIFSATNRTDGARHRYISSFDMQEPGGLYFLAMLPGRGKCSTYDEALDLLAPEIVKKNREVGRSVYRQGDVFAIETDLSDEQVYDGAVTRVRRAIAMQDMRTVQTQGRLPIPPAEGEVWEYGSCPFCSSSRHRIGSGPRARAALSIHATGHTADEVVVKDNGITFVRGLMFHDPMIEDATRTEPDHRTIPLGPDVQGHGGTRNSTPDVVGKWYLAVRNTVPRVRRRAAPEVVELPMTSTSESTAEERQEAAREPVAV